MAATGACGTVEKRDQLSSDSILSLFRGDPTLYEPYWRMMTDKATVEIPPEKYVGYFTGDENKNICWFLEAELEEEVRRLHGVVGNAVTEGRHIVVGNGSTQLFQAALFALSPPGAARPLSVVSAAPYYSLYPTLTDFLQSGLHKWAGDANTFTEEVPYIELVTSPNNPDGSIREAVLNRDHGKTIHDLAYYWPQYTPITSPADHDIMLFTQSKTTGHAGSRIGWAIVKDQEVAENMTKFIEISTIGVSKDSQFRAAAILRAVSDGCEKNSGSGDKPESFFEFGRRHMTERWEKLRDVIERSGRFSLPVYPTALCNFTGESTEAHPAFAWLKAKEEMDSESFLRAHRILTRSGKQFGADAKYARVSMLDTDERFDLLLQRLSSM